MKEPFSQHPDGLCDVVRAVLREALESEMTEAVEAAKGDRSDGRQSRFGPDRGRAQALSRKPRMPGRRSTIYAAPSAILRLRRRRAITAGRGKSDKIAILRTAHRRAKNES